MAKKEKKQKKDPSESPKQEVDAVKGFIVVMIVLMLMSGCGQVEVPEPVEPAPPDYAARAEQLAQEILLLDTHVDLPYRLHEHPEAVNVLTEDGHFDLVRARAGGLDAAFMSIYVPASYQETGGAIGDVRVVPGERHVLSTARRVERPHR